MGELYKKIKLAREFIYAVALIVGGWFVIETLFVTRVLFTQHTIEEIEGDIDVLEERRDFYQTKIDNNEPLEPSEKRRLRITEGKLDKKYDALEEEEQLLKELEEYRRLDNLIGN